jgi:UDP-N-acetyl-D-glucosamine dehydrogenase
MEPEWGRALLDRINDRDATVAVIGLGYVGLPLALQAVDRGFTVVGIDSDADRLDAVASGKSYLVDVDDSALSGALSSGRFSVDRAMERVADARITLICVPTPLLGDTPDLSFVTSAVEAIAPFIAPGSLISLESTTWPGTTEEVVRQRLESGGLKAGKDFALVFSPERIEPGNRRFAFSDIPKVVGGLTDFCGLVGATFYEALTDSVVNVSNPRAAEMVKLLENTYRQVNIALANEFAMVAKELGIDIWEVINAAATKPFGFQPFYPGIGIGGHCVAVDPVYLTWRIRELGRGPFRLIELAREVDETMPTYVVGRIREMLKARGLDLGSASVLALGVTYKPDVADIRESRAVDVIGILLKEGARVGFHDPFHDELEVGGTHLAREALDDALAEADLTVILTHHSTYEWPEIVERSRLVFDARGATQGIDAENVERL